MGLLERIAGAIKWIVIAPFVAVNYVLNQFADAGERMRASVEELTGVRKKPPREKIRAALRQQYLDLAPGSREEIPGVEWEGEIYYKTPQ